MKNRLYTSVFITVTLILIFLGMRASEAFDAIPDCYVAVKACTKSIAHDTDADDDVHQHQCNKKLNAEEAPSPYIPTYTPPLINSTFNQEIHKHTSIVISQLSARASPLA